MNEEEIIKNIQESKAKQELREHLTGQNESQQFINESNCDELHKKVLNEYNSMSEGEKNDFTRKQWTGD